MATALLGLQLDSSVHPESGIVVVTIVHNIRSEGHPYHQVFTPLLGCRMAQEAAHSCILVAATPVESVLAWWRRQQFKLLQLEDRGCPYQSLVTI